MTLAIHALRFLLQQQKTNDVFQIVWMKHFNRVLVITILFISSIGCVQSARFPDLSGEPILNDDQLEVVANLTLPPGNVAVAENGRLFFTYMPEARPSISVAEWVDGAALPFPDSSWQPSGTRNDKFISVLPLRIDQQNRLWLIDSGFHGILQRVRIFAFDITTKTLVYQQTLPISVMGMGSYANDFQVSQDGKWLYISDSGIVNGTPAIIVYDVENNLARRVLNKHSSVSAGRYEPVIQGVEMSIPNLFTLNPGVDGLALSQDGTTLFYEGFSNENLYRISTATLNNFSLGLHDIAAQVNLVGAKTMSDGITTDLDDNIYLTDMEHDAIIRMTPTGEMTTVFKTPLLRWPDGFSHGPDNYLYISCSALHQVFNRSRDFVLAHGPYQIFRFKLESADANP
jgi:sugar lactone lactonase YvrE